MRVVGFYAALRNVSNVVWLCYRRMYRVHWVHYVHVLVDQISMSSTASLCESIKY